jgi:hypothetical protein
MSRLAITAAAFAAVLAFPLILSSTVPATAVTPGECGGRIVEKPMAPVKPGCRRGGCRIFLTPARDAKGPYCIRSRGCHVRCGR